MFPAFFKIFTFGTGISPLFPVSLGRAGLPALIKTAQNGHKLGIKQGERTPLFASGFPLS